MSSDDDRQLDRRPALRASDRDRERVVDVLRQAAGEGRLDFEELDERVTAAYSIRALTDLEGLTHDLVPAGTAAPAAGSPPVIDPRPGGTERIVAVMGGHERRGRWRLAARCLVLSIMGGAELDMREVELSAPQTTIRVFTLMGGAQLRLPTGVEVQVSKFAFMGGHDVRLDDRPPAPGAPVIHVALWSLMGGTEVRQGPGRERVDRTHARDRLDAGGPQR